MSFTVLYFSIGRFILQRRVVFAHFLKCVDLLKGDWKRPQLAWKDLHVSVFRHKYIMKECVVYISFFVIRYTCMLVFLYYTGNAFFETQLFCRSRSVGHQLMPYNIFCVCWCYVLRWIWCYVLRWCLTTVGIEPVTFGILFTVSKKGQRRSKTCEACEECFDQSNCHEIYNFRKAGRIIYCAYLQKPWFLLSFLLTKLNKQKESFIQAYYLGDA